MKNYKIYPENLIDLQYDETVNWLVCDTRNWDKNIISGKTFSSFSVARSYCQENPSLNFIITEV